MELVEQLEISQARSNPIKLNFKRTIEKLKEIKRKTKKEFLWSIKRKEKAIEGRKDLDKNKVK